MPVRPYLLRVLAPLAALSLVLAAYLFLGTGTNGKMRTILTIYVDGQALENGAVVEVFPIPVPHTRLEQESVKDNPAQSDQTLDAMHPLGKHDQRAGVVVSDQYSQVQLLYPEEGTFSFNFKPAATTRPELWGAFRTEQVSIGGTDFSGKGPVREFGYVGDHPSGSQTVLVQGPGMSARNARVIESVASSLDPAHFICKAYSKAMVCAPNALGREEIARLQAAELRRELAEDDSQ